MILLLRKLWVGFKFFLKPILRLLSSIVLSSAKVLLGGFWDTLIFAVRFGFGIIIGFVLGIALINVFFDVFWVSGIALSKLIYLVASILLAILKFL